MYGACCRHLFLKTKLFENDVEMYGAQAFREVTKPTSQFENDVEMYGAQANFVI